MNRVPTTFGLILLVLCAIAVMAPAAAMANEELESGEAEEGAVYPLTVTANQIGNQNLTVGTEERKAPITCSTAKFTGELEGPSEEIWLTPAYSGCKYKMAKNVDFNANGCKYLLYETSTLFPARLQIHCPVGAEPKFEITVANVVVCTVNISPGGSGSVALTNKSGPPKDIRMDISFEFLYAFEQVVAGGCAGETTGSLMLGEYSGSMTMTGETSKGEPYGISVG